VRDFVLTKHAIAEAGRRGIPLDVVRAVASAPEQIVDGYGGLRVYQSRVEFDGGRRYLVRVVVNDAVEPGRVVTVYRTTKIGKYWRTA
jgi:hypothetical protein